MRRNAGIDLLPSGTWVRSTTFIDSSLHILRNSDSQSVWNSTDDRFVPPFESFDYVVAVSVIGRELAIRNELDNGSVRHYPQADLMLNTPVYSFPARLRANYTENVIGTDREPF